MAAIKIPSTFRAWHYDSASGGIEKNLKIKDLPMIKPNSKSQHLVQVLAAAINPVDYKPAEIPGVSLLGVKGSPGIDFCGRIVQPADGSPLQPGQVIFGSAGTGGLMGGALGQYTIARPSGVAVVPEGISYTDAGAANIGAVTAYQTTVPYVKEGSNVFINGGSGGTGTFGIQIAKALGCYVTTTCSTPNVELCRSLGADQVIDYRQSSVLESLKASGRKYDHVIDNVGFDSSLYWSCHEYTNPGAIYFFVGGKLSFRALLERAAMYTLPAFLGGGQRKIQGLLAVSKTEELDVIAKWMAEGKVKPVIDSTFKFEDAPKAFERLKTGRAKGKIVVEISS